MRPYLAVTDCKIGRRFSAPLVMRLGTAKPGAKRDQKVTFFGLILAPLIGGLGRINRAQKPFSRVHVGFWRPCYAVTGRKTRAQIGPFLIHFSKRHHFIWIILFKLADGLSSFSTQLKSFFESKNISSQLRYHILHSLFFMMQNPLYMHV